MVSIFAANIMETNNPNLTPEGNFTLTYFPYAEDAEPHTPLEEAIQCLSDCLPKTEEEILQNIQRYHQQCRPLTRKKKHQLKTVINNVLQPAGEEGNQDAIYWMFFAYSYGLGVEQDEEKAIEYLKILAEYGYPDMQCELGKEYATIDWSCITHDEEELENKEHEAFKWFAKSAEQGNVEAMFCLGECYRDGTGVDQDYEKAFEWFAKAAELGYEEAMPDLAFLYERGAGVEKNLDAAAEWYDKAGWHEKATRLRNGEDLWKMDEKWKMDEDGFWYDSSMPPVWFQDKY